MSVHEHPNLDARDEFLVDGCPRCEEYVRDLGIHFDAERWRAFWEKMVAVEFDDDGSYASELDKQLGSRLYLVALGLQRATGRLPRDFDHMVFFPGPLESADVP